MSSNQTDVSADATTAYGVISIDDNYECSMNMVGLPAYGVATTTCDAWSSPMYESEDDILKSVVMSHDADMSFVTEECEACFLDDGALFVRCSLPCDNYIRLFVGSGRDPVQACDIAMDRLEEMKKAIERTQERLFELSLRQKVGGND